MENASLAARFITVTIGAWSAKSKLPVGVKVTSTGCFFRLQASVDIRLRTPQKDLEGLGGELKRVVDHFQNLLSGPDS